jgi:hypothetical protein
MKRLKRGRKETRTSEWNEFIKTYNSLKDKNPDALRAKIQEFKEYLDFKRQPHQVSLWESNRRQFPPKWMTDEEKIAEVIERYPSFIPIVKYLINHNRYWHGSDKEERIKMQKVADKITGGKKYKSKKGDRIYSTFLTGKAFYDGICRKTRYSKNTIQSYLKAFVKIGCLEKLDKGNGGKGVLYADGYYVPAPDNKFRKISFLIKSPEMISGLKKLPELIKGYHAIKRVKRHA